MSNSYLRKFSSPGARTRIVATLGPKSWNEATILGMAEAGASAFRLNFSHGKYEDHARSVELVRKISKKIGRPIAILQDLQGPKIRSGALLNDRPVNLVVGETVEVTHTEKFTRPGLIATTYTQLVSDVDVGHRLLLDDGHLELRCTEKTDDRLICEVIGGGLLYSNKGINLPGVQVSQPSLTAKDKKDLKFGLSLGVDYVALSFVRKAQDVRELRKLTKRLGYVVAIIAKLEKPQAVEPDTLKEILEAAEGIMVARGDLGVEVPSERLPVLQKEIIARARERGRIVITATQMLESMIENPRPTRAETSDVANAILDGTDAVMLSGETAVGKHPIRAVQTMRAIASFTEESALYQRVTSELPLDHGGDIADATVHAACTAAREIGAKAVMAFTSSGRTCFKVSFARPRTRMFGATFTERAWNRLALCWGVDALLMPEARSVGELYYLAEKHLLEKGLVRSGDLIVLITGSNIGAGHTNSIKVHRVGLIDVTDEPKYVRLFKRLYTTHHVKAPAHPDSYRVDPSRHSNQDETGDPVDA